MKQHYLKSTAIVAMMVIAVNFLPKAVGAQCTCNGGLAPDTITQTQTLDPITAINTPIVFNQFNPSVGTLNCFKLSSYVTTIIEIDLANKESFDVTYLLESFRRSIFTGPNGFVSNSSSPTKQYGPYNLKASDGAATNLDEVKIGPDTAFKNYYQERLYGGSPGYTGAGTVTFNYLNTSTNTLLLGSGNYDLQVRSNSRLNVRLQYYYCPNEVLSSNIQQFTVAKKEGNIALSWQAQNASNIKEFVIETSTDGKAFKATAHVEGNSQANALYNQQIKATSGGKYMYVRLRQTDSQGKHSYTAIRIVALDEKAGTGIFTYPNPAVNGITVSFDRLATGTYRADLVSLSGQVLFSQTHQLKNANTLPVNWVCKPVNGLYLLKITNEQTSEQKVVRVNIQ
jgi:hypothetical protein